MSIILICLSGRRACCSFRKDGFLGQCQLTNVSSIPWALLLHSIWNTKILSGMRRDRHFFHRLENFLEKAKGLDKITTPLKNRTQQNSLTRGYSGFLLCSSVFPQSCILWYPDGCSSTGGTFVQGRALAAPQGPELQAGAASGPWHAAHPYPPPP